MLAKFKNMFVMNFGAGTENPYTPAVIPNDAIESQDGFPGAGMPMLWLLNANEGSGYPFRVVNFLWGYAHRRDVYAAITIPDPNNTDNPQEGEDPTLFTKKCVGGTIQEQVKLSQKKAFFLVAKRENLGRQ